MRSDYLYLANALLILERVLYLMLDPYRYRAIIGAGKIKVSILNRYAADLILA